MPHQQVRGGVSARREGDANSSTSRESIAAGAIRVAVAVLPALFSEALVNDLKREPDLRVIGRLTDEDAIGCVLKKERPRVLVFDYEGLGPNAERVISRLRHDVPSTRILVLATRSSPEMVERMLRAGASGLVDKHLELATLVRAIRALAGGELWADRRATAEFVDHLTESLSHTASSTNQLTDREWEVADGVGQGLRNKEIAHRLSISQKTVKSHLNNIFRKLGVDNRFAAGMYARSRTLLSVYLLVASPELVDTLATFLQLQA
jgi:two-component system, NarL family, response regulator DegU